MNMGFCNTNQNIERAILAWQQNTAQIIASSQANVQKVLDKLCEQETQNLRTALAEARVIAQNNQQTNEIISRLSPTPTPSWIVASPYTSIYPPTTSTTGS
jgi:23S rRNA C2498 (ribose-2'-O)-methylase RlmM